MIHKRSTPLEQSVKNILLDGFNLFHVRVEHSSFFYSSCFLGGGLGKFFFLA